ncbi:MAG: SET domain-containing protein-lysine N-methyltransferase [Silvibacterium sp.]|jgi:SET domain-containing protein
MTLIIRSSQIHAAGCYTTEPIRKRSRIVEYTGPHISKEAADEKYRDSPTTYLFGLGNGSKVIDGHGIAMFINHSCDPNCETGEVRGKVWVKALRDIAAGEELTYDYNLYDGDDDEALCNCGAENCRKSMYSPEELKRRARAAKRASAKKALNRKAAGKKRART